MGDWIKRHDHALKIGPNTHPRDVYAKRRTVRKSVDEIEDQAQERPHLPLASRSR